MNYAEQANSEAGLPLSRVAAGLWDRYGDERKLANAKRLRGQTERCTAKVTAFPWRVILEPHECGNPNCGGCGTQESDLPQGTLRADDVDRFLGELWPYLVQVNLFHWGEPFSNRQLPQIVSRIHAQSVGTHIHSNLEYLPEDICRGVIGAGLDYIVVSLGGLRSENCDNATAGAYQHRHDNLQKLCRLRDASPEGDLRIVWRFTGSPDNFHDIEWGRRLADDLGLDDFVVEKANANGSGRCGPGSNGSHGKMNQYFDNPLCTDLWDFPAIHFDGTLMSCCVADSKQFVWGDLKQQSWMQAYNTPPFQQSRRMAACDSTAVSPCLGCQKMTPMRQRSARDVRLEVLSMAG